MKEQYKERFYNIVESPNQDVLVDRLCSFCDFIYLELSKKLKKLNLDKDRADYLLVLIIESFNKEINEVVDEINAYEKVKAKVSNNLLYGLIGTYNKMLWELFKMRYVEIYN